MMLVYSVHGIDINYIGTNNSNLTIVYDMQITEIFMAFINRSIAEGGPHCGYGYQQTVYIIANSLGNI